jgi:glucose-1-phosphate cytidylyltransferase
MDTLRDKAVLEDLWEKGKPPWCVWSKASVPPNEGVTATEPAFAGPPTY